ncbi:MAG TPA: nucleotidyltransferase domain-containing protein [bacterium]|jgi:predicted nucleotidyltransferase|nr:nucleotidyltransferase domain-containing protein [bacterium]HNZ54790.1 nucleotidyltransferase domain-containing protein [bacterium]HOG43519.1 nucleotidyltransferase domain-containing protein [bacterium]HPA57846.1 nucleotidyltransferase domain-containing protein [bacterium]HPG36193.1 nucleotidyltransferase domain-containing protein [bacterium]
MIDLSPKHLETVREILKYHLPVCEVRVFGSRIKGTAKSYSDLDIALVCKEKIQRKKLHEIREAFEESDLPIRIDIIDFNAISKEFQEVICQKYEVL